MNLETGRAEVGSGASKLGLSRANYTVARLRRDILSHSSVGVIFLNRQGGTGLDYNRALGFDVNLALGADARLTALAARSFTPGGSGEDYAFGLDLANQTDRYTYDLTYLDIGRRFTADMGYVPRVDIRHPRLRAAWTPRPGWRGVRQLSFGGSVESYMTHAGVTESKTADGQVGVTFDDTSLLTFDLVRDYDLLTSPWKLGSQAIPVGGYRWSTARVSYASSPRRRIAGTGYIEAGGYYGGDKSTVGAGLTFVPRDTLTLDVNLNRNRVTLPGAAPYITNTIGTRVSYSFSPTVFAKAFVQYNDDRQLASLNLLFWSIYRPGSDLYVVYNQQWDTDLPGERFLRRKNRSLSVKFTYWLSR